MPRNYDNIEEKISETGFFSEYLPPCFKLDRTIFLHPPTENCDLIEPYCYTMSRFSGNDARRNIFIPEIGSYLVAQQYMRQTKIIKEIIEFSENSKFSFSPILGKDDNVMRHEQVYTSVPMGLDEISSDYIENIAEKMIRSTGAKQILKLDISNCFSSFYMHMIPSILLGKDNAENEYKKYLKDKADTTINSTYLKYKKLDMVIRHQNLNRTNGLLPGILSSKIIVEGILSRIDIELECQGINFSRYVDDYEVYLYNGEKKEVISIFNKILNRYGFTLNAEKTEIIDFPYYIVDNLGQLFLSRSEESLDTAKTMALFDVFLSLEKSGTKGAIRYLLKSIEKKQIQTDNSKLYKSYLLTIIGNNERSLTKACSLLIGNRDSLTLDSIDITFIKNLLVLHLDCDHDLEVVWLLYLLIKTENIEMGDSTIKSIVDSHNELAKILLLRNTLLSEELLDSAKNSATSWILLYELYAGNQISENIFSDKLNINKNLNMYQYFKNSNVHFVLKE